MKQTIVRVARGGVTCALFGLFGIGALLISPVVVLLQTPERGQRVVRTSWRLAMWLFERTRMIRVDRSNLADVRGAVIAANHPSLIDVVLLTAMIPRTVYVAKRALRKNPFLAAIVRTTAIADDASFVESAAALLKRGWNVLIFPEGTRTPYSSVRNDPAGSRARHDCGNSLPSIRFHRGAAQVALRTGAPILPIRIDVSRRILAKGQRPWDVGEHVVDYRFCAREPMAAVCESGESLHSAAVRVTAELEARLSPASATPSAPALPPPGFIAVVPVCNPEPGMIPLCRSLVGNFTAVIVVDDGSVLDCGRFSELPSEVIRLRHETNRGKGAAMKTALAWVAANRPDACGVVFADGDGQHRIEDVVRVAADCARKDRVVFGVRDLSLGKVPFRSWWGNRWTSVEVRILCGYRLKDTQTGLRAVPARLLGHLLKLRGERFEYESGWFGLLKRLGEKIETLPIETIYRNGNRASHFRPWRDTWLTQCALFK